MNYGGRLKEGIVYLGGLDQVHHQEKVTPELLSRVENVVLAACGTSHFACRYAEYVIRRMGVFQYVKAQIASEIQPQDLHFRDPRRSLFLSVSQSGETQDLLIPFRLAA